MPKTMHIDAPIATMFETPKLSGEPINTLLYGESITAHKQKGQVAKITVDHDGYEGFIDAELLAEHRPKTHKVIVPMTHLYETPDFKNEPFVPLYMLSPVHATSDKKDGFVKLGNGKWIFEEHLGSIDDTHMDFAEMALKFLYTPYAWGGRTAAGIDCSGLVQLCLNAAGLPCPRDTKDQIKVYGENVDPSGKLRRGDLVFFERHVGIMLDSTLIVNATSRHMATVVEELTAVSHAYNGIIAVRRVGRPPAA
jgi:cell wall-associated NlpC family hydrolase